MKHIPIGLVALAVSLLFSQAQDTKPQKRSAELQVLDRFVGVWDVEVTANPTQGERSTYKALSSRAWSLGGAFIRFEDSSPENAQQPEIQILMTYDPEAENYPGVMMSGVTRSEITGTWDEKSQTMTLTAEFPGGNRLISKHRFVGEDRAEPKGAITTSDGTVLVELSWTQTRRKPTGHSK